MDVSVLPLISTYCGVSMSEYSTVEISTGIKETISAAFSKTEYWRCNVMTEVSISFETVCW